MSPPASPRPGTPAGPHGGGREADAAAGPPDGRSGAGRSPRSPAGERGVDTPAQRPVAPSPDAAWRALHAAACAPYRASGRFAWHWARGKLGRDPVFRGLLERGDLPAGVRLVDIGCGQGLLASLLHAARAQQQAGGWPAAWPVRASLAHYHGIELMARDVDRGRAALAPLAAAGLAAELVCDDMRRAALPPCDAVVILDVLHYVDHDAQAALLARVHDALAPARGRLLLRVGDAADRGGFRASQWVDRVVTAVRGHRVAPTFGRSLAQWRALLAERGFGAVRAVPQSQGTPFANVLLVAAAGAAR